MIVAAVTEAMFTFGFILGALAGGATVFVALTRLDRLVRWLEGRNEMCEVIQFEERREILRPGRYWT